MSTLNTFDFGYFQGLNTFPKELTGLYTGLMDFDKEAKSGTKPELDCSFSVMQGYLNNTIDLTKEFNICGWNKRHNEFSQKKEYRKAKKFVDVGFEEDASETGTEASYVSKDIAKVNAREVADVFDSILDEEEVIYAVQTIKALSAQILIEERVGILCALRQGLKEVPAAVESLRRICKDYLVLAEQIQIILTSGHTFDELFCTETA